MPYIDSDKLIKELSTMYKEPTSTEDFMTVGYDKAIADVVVTAHRQPTADVAEVKHGKWIEARPMSGRVGKVCSACGNEAYWDSDYGQQLFDWCPYCGADMGEEDNE